MTLHFSHDDFSADLPPELRRLDDALADLASVGPTPPGLTERVYAASVSELPARLRLVGSRRASARTVTWLSRPAWGQLAMAAGLALAFVVGAWFLAGQGPGHSPGVSSSGTMRADGTGAAAQPVVRTVAMRSLSPEAELLLWESLNDGDSARYLVLSRDASLADFEGEAREYALLFEDFEL